VGQGANQVMPKEWQQDFKAEATPKKQRRKETAISPDK
jgi:hypothetical protein